MDWTAHRKLADRWTQQTRSYVAAVNAYVEKGNRIGWDAVGPEPLDLRTAEDAERVIQVVREANAAGEWRDLRRCFPPAHAPFIERLQHAAQGFDQVCFVDADRVVARIGGSRRPDAVMVFGLDGEASVVADAVAVGASPDRQYWAVVLRGDEALRVRISSRWGGSCLVELDLPSREALDIEQLTVLPGGVGCVLATSCGVLVADETKVRRIFPHSDGGDERGEEDVSHLDMVHMAVHPSGKLIACGAQMSQHEVYRTSGERVARFGPIHSEYPHHAAFSPDGRHAMFNSCHFYNGATRVGRTDELLGVEIDCYVEDVRLLPLDDGCRVYDSSFHDGCFLLGDAHGYVRARTIGGEPRWQHFVGSSIGGIDVSSDGSRMAVGTYAGFLSIVDLDSDEADPFQIGTGSHRERLRYVKWRGEPLWRW